MSRLSFKGGLVQPRLFTTCGRRGSMLIFGCIVASDREVALFRWVSVIFVIHNGNSAG